MSEIVKVQRPISTNDPRQPWLIYNRSGKRMVHIADTDVPPRIRVATRGNSKAYFVAEWSKDVGLSLGERVWEQSW